MPPRGTATCTPGIAASSGSSVSRQVARCATIVGVISSRCASAASAARCVNTLAHDVLNSISLPIASVSVAGTTSQPRRQPVIRKLFEKLCATIRRSSGAAMSRKLGAQPLAVGSKYRRS